MQCTIAHFQCIKTRDTSRAVLRGTEQHTAVPNDVHTSKRCHVDREQPAISTPPSVDRRRNDIQLEKAA